MRMTKVALSVVALTLVFFAFSAAGDKPWFDNGKCDFCKNLAAEPGLMDHITKWEHHNTKNGGVTITVVDPEYIGAYKRAMGKMEAVGKRMEAGEKVNTCGMCDAYGMIYMKGAQWDVVESGNTFISLMWSDKPEVVKMIHAMNDRTNKEMAMMADKDKMKMKKTDKMKDMHKEHDHK